MVVKKSFFGWMSLLAFGLASTTSYASCGSALCPLNTQLGLQEYSNIKSTQLDLHFEWIDQGQPRNKTNDVAVGEISAHHDEVRTINRNTILTLDHTINEQFSVAVSVPWRTVSHDHIHNHNQGTEHIPERWDFSEVGDVQVVGRYQRIPNKGLLAGLKLPTGSFTVKNEEGDAAERTLQPGSGTTDILVGAYFQHHDIRSPNNWFAQALWQVPLNSRDNFKPGGSVKLEGGVQYSASAQWSLLAQLNVVIKARDKGDEAESEDSGSKSIYFSPGVSFAATPTMRIYSFLQQPLYQNMNGVQLTADYSAVVGIKSSF